MSKKLMFIEVRGQTKTWSFEFYGDDKYLKQWQDDGLTVEIICNSIPVWVVDLGLMNVWIFFQDALNFKNPFGGN